MAARLDVAKVIKHVRTRLGISQEGLSRRVNATKGAVQHWERGRNQPDLARLLALQQICPPGAERKQLDAVIKEAQTRVATPAGGFVATPSLERPSALQRENSRLRQQVDKLGAQLDRRSEQIHTLEAMARDLQRQMAELHATKSGGEEKTE